MNSRLVVFFVFTLLCTLVPAAAQESVDIPAAIAAYPDVILYNGKVLTVDAKFTVAEAVAVRNDKIAAVGKSNDVLRPDGHRSHTVVHLYAVAIDLYSIAHIHFF